MRVNGAIKIYLSNFAHIIIMKCSLFESRVIDAFHLELIAWHKVSGEVSLQRRRTLRMIRNLRILSSSMIKKKDFGMMEVGFCSVVSYILVAACYLVQLF